ncbi:septum site-determining protein Ssd [Saccharomonospora glauca]|jgi:secretion/DNA translocation related CpaE-like protein|uniref:Helicase/secretion neighborhood CpaE-like protein n=1 Tax=Saccharomonospora glauca K62 TaxID=928724 RepID=I1D7A0_9PSEU|nr:septum site-determining protein Ssd [Saccharomonospora glauca]EIF00825.1 helicase/secretion neighborhood CpaE-like protein [Saccharomonospora glauca K62]
MTDNRPLVVVSDETVREHVVRLAAAVGCEPDQAREISAVRARWTEAPLVLLDRVPDVGGLPRRSNVLLVRTEAPTQAEWKAAVSLGVDGVAILPADEELVVTSLADVVERPSAREGRVLAVVGGRGGAGASVLAASVAVTAARSGEAVLLVDCDPLGGGIDLVLGTEADEGLRWPDLRMPAGRVAMSELDAALPTRRRGRGRLSVLSCGRTGPGPTDVALAAVVDAGRRAGRTVVCDVPRYPDGAADEVLHRADLTVLVVSADVHGCVAAARVRRRLSERTSRIGIAVRSRVGNGLSEADVAEALGAPVLAWVGHDNAVGRILDSGSFRPTRRLRKAARTILATLAC